MSINKKIKKIFGVVGCNIEYSRSPIIHHLFSKITGIDLDYNIFSISNNKNVFEGFVNNFFKNNNLDNNLNPDLNTGLNITIPFKQRAYNLCDIVSDDAKAIKAVNTLWYKNNKIYGDSTDGFGFISDIHHKFGNLKNQNVLLIGAGGAARSIVPSILADKPSNIYILNRDLTRANNLIGEFKELSNKYSVNLEIFNNNNINILINSATDKALLDANIKKLLLLLIKKNNNNLKFIYDLSYANKSSLTRFCELAQENNINYSDGLGMLVHQAVKSFSIWNNIELSRDDLLDVIKQIKL